MCRELIKRAAVSRDRRSLLQSIAAVVAGTVVGPDVHASEPDRRFSPLEFGAVGDGRADDTNAIQRASDAAQAGQGTLWLPGTYVFGFRSNIYIKNGVRSVEGPGTLKVLSTATTVCSIVGAGRASGNAENLTACIFRDFTFDANHKHSLGAYFQNAQRCGAVGLRIINMTDVGIGILFKSFASGGTPGRGNYARGCVVEGSTQKQPKGSIGIAFASEVDLGSAGDLTKFWKSKFRAPPAPFAEQDGYVEDCTVSGCYYGLSLGAAQGIKVNRFRSRYNMRCISIQSGSCDNHLTNLLLQDSISSAVLIGYGSSRNVVMDAVAKTSRANGEALFQSILGSQQNHFRRCRTIVTEGAPQYHYYCAIESDDCEFVNCTAKGRALLAYAGIESAWSSRVKHRSHHARGFGTQLDGFAHEGMSGVKIEGLSIDGSSAVPGIFVAQISDSRGVYRLSNLGISADSVTGHGFSVPIENLEMHP